MAPLRILVVEDEESIALNIAEYLEPRGYVLDFAINGEQALSQALSETYDVILLDIMLPRKDGVAVCEQIRAASRRHVPILMLTARDTEEDKVKGFRAGADDYLTKPFSLAELEARCIALSRRNLLHTEHLIDLGELQVDRRARKVWRQGRQLQLKRTGFDIVEALAMAHPAVVSRSDLISILWGDDPTESDSLRSHIYQLRAQLDKPFDTAMLQTVHGVGFALAIEDKERA